MNAPTQSDAPVEIEPYNANWPRLFELEARSLSEVLGPWIVGAIEHVGSTAVRGLSAKPVIDIMAPVSGLDDSLPAIEALSGLGYCHFPYKSDQMHWFCKPSPAHRTHHLHIVPLASVTWRDRLAFRDALRGNTELADEYQTLKLRLARAHAHDREAYTEGKTPFVQSVLNRVCPRAA